MKFICAILVVSIHKNPFSLNIWLSNGLEVVNRIAVPYFFISSSFFFFLKIDEHDIFLKDNISKLKKFVGHIAALYLIWSAIYFPLKFSSWMADGKILFSEVINYTVRLAITGSYTHLWYLVHLIYGVVIVFILRKFVKIKTIFIIGLLFYLLGLSISTYYNFFEGIYIIDIVKSAENLMFWRLYEVFFSLPCVAAGFMIAKKESKTKTFYLLGTVLIGILYVIESSVGMFVMRFQDIIIWIALIPLVYFLFMINIKIEIKDSVIFKYLRTTSIIMYVSHYLFIRAFDFIFISFGIYGWPYSSFVIFLLVIISSTLLSAVMMILSVRVHFCWLKYLC